MNNPYIIIAIMLVVDIITLPFFIKSILKKENLKRKGLVISLALVAFVALEAVASFVYIDSKQFYDREGNAYLEEESVLYYDREGTEFLLKDAGLNRKKLESTDGRRTLAADRVYLDMQGYIVLDLKQTFEQTDKKYIYTDSDGNKYYKLEDVSFNRDGEMQLNVE